jgi:hypothetical protein
MTTPAAHRPLIGARRMHLGDTTFRISLFAAGAVVIIVLF